MRVDGEHYQTIWLNPQDAACVEIIDQRFLPHDFVIEQLRCLDDAVVAIRDMHVRGAPLIGATAAWAMYLAAVRSGKENLQGASERLKQARPTAVNLAWAVDRVLKALKSSEGNAVDTARLEAEAICGEDVEICRLIGEHGLSLIETIAKQKPGKPINILTHCNAGWLATVDWGTATSPIYHAQQKGIDVHVWVDETRPRNQGASLTAWELGQQGIEHTVIVDNAGGHLMQNGEVDMVIVGTDRTTRNGDVVNKIGTYLKALAAYDNHIPFYVALPSPTIDWYLDSGNEVPIEHRSQDEVSFIDGWYNNAIAKVRLTSTVSPAANPAFDMTPARLVSGLITERGICEASEAGLVSLFPEKAGGNG